MLNSQTISLLESSERRFRTLAQATFEGITLSENGVIYEANEQFARMHGYQLPEVIGRPIADFLLPQDHERARQVIASDEKQLGEYHALRKDGSTFLLEVQVYRSEQNGRSVHVAAQRDVTGRKRKEEELTRLNRILKAHSHSDQAMMRATAEPEYLADVCRIITEDCGHKMVWIGYAQDDADKTVRPMAYAGFDQGYLETLKITWADTERGRGPTGMAIRTGKPCGCQNMLTDPDFAPWRTEALRRGYSSSIVVPLLADGRAFGAMTIYSGEPDSFSADEVTLLASLADDLAYGITAIRLRASHARAEKECGLHVMNWSREFRNAPSSWPRSMRYCGPRSSSAAKSSGRLRLQTTAIEAAANGILITDRHGNIQWSNPAFTHMTGYSAAEALGQNMRLLKSNEQPPEFYRQLWETIVAGQVWHGELVNRRKDGSRYVEEQTITPVLDRSGYVAHFIAIKQNITERKQAEESLRASEVRFRTVADFTYDWEYWIGPDRQPIYITPSCERVTGYRAAEFVSDPDLLTRIIHPDDRALYASHLHAVSHHGDLVPIDFRITRRDGELRWIAHVCRSVYDDQGYALGHRISNRDITERKRAEDRLEQTNRDLLASSLAERNQRQLTETLAAANSALTQSLDLEVVLEALLDHIECLVPYDSANVMLLEAESRLSVRIARGYERWSNVEAVRAITFDSQVNPLFNSILTTRRSCLVSDTRHQSEWEVQPGVEHVRSWLGVPLTAGGSVIGLYSLDKTEPGFFTLEHVIKAEMLAGQAAVAIQNAWLFEQVRAGRERLQSLSRRLVEVQEAERQYVARELHDEAGQALTSLLFGLSQIEQQADNAPQTARIAKLKELTNDIIENLHRLAMDLRPASLDHLGLEPALLQQVRAVSDRNGLIAQFKSIGLDGERLPSEVETALYRIVQESLTNIIRHAQATRVNVLLERRGDRVVVVVEDDGIGFDTEDARCTQAGHLGLAGMQERAEMLGGSFVVESAGTGTTVVVEVPYDNSHPGRR